MPAPDRIVVASAAVTVTIAAGCEAASYDLDLELRAKSARPAVIPFSIEFPYARPEQIGRLRASVDGGDAPAVEREVGVTPGSARLTFPNLFQSGTEAKPAVRLEISFDLPAQTSASPRGFFQPRLFSSTLCHVVSTERVMVRFVAPAGARIVAAVPFASIQNGVATFAEHRLPPGAWSTQTVILRRRWRLPAVLHHAGLAAIFEFAKWWMLDHC